MNKPLKGLRQHCEGSMFDRCGECPYYEVDHEPFVCRDMLLSDLNEYIKALLKEQEAERERMVTWLGKFCRHIDNGDAWLPDDENIALFRKKMKQQFGWQV